MAASVELQLRSVKSCKFATLRSIERNEDCYGKVGPEFDSRLVKHLSLLELPINEEALVFHHLVVTKTGRLKPNNTKSKDGNFLKTAIAKMTLYEGHIYSKVPKDPG